MTPELRLFGHPERSIDGDWRPLPPTQALLLGAYLVWHEDWVQRDALLALFWPDQDEKSARHNLSQLLYHARRQPWAAGLEAERTRVRWAVASDLAAFREAVAGGDWAQAVELGRGELLGGGAAEGSAPVQSWLEEARETSASDWRAAALRHATALDGGGEAGPAATLLREVLRRDPLAEEVLQAYLRCAAGGGQRERALATFESFRDTLQRELELEPLEETVALAERLRSDRAPQIAIGAAPEPAESAPAAAPRSALPPPRTPFVGRDPELSELQRLLTLTDNRLLTLVGPGGIGKTRLALEVARGLEGPSARTTLVELATVTQPERMLPAVAEALELPAADDEPLERIATALTGSTMLILDNFEQLLDASPELLELLDRAPELRLIVTSRTPLDLPGERVFALDGLITPDDDVGDPEAYDAVDLFVRSARRANRHFHLDDANRDATVRLCRLLDGLPLGLELAASWSRMLTPQELLDEVEADLSLLESDGGGVPERHRSLEAVFLSSWELLADDEREGLLRLAVFRGGFDHRAAREGAGVGLRTLLALVDRSLLQRGEGGRFERHLTVRRFSEERLERDPERYREARERHAATYLELARALEPTLTGPDQIASLARLEREHDNLRVALDWYRDHDTDTGLALASTLMRFWWLRGHYREGRRRYDELLAADPPPSPQLGRALNSAGSLARLCEDYPAARALMERALVIDEQLGLTRGIAAVHGNLAMLDRIEGDTAAARAHMERALELYRELGDRRQVASGVNNLAAIALTEGDADEAERLNRESLALAREIDEPFVEARSLGNLADLLLTRGAEAEAEEHYRASLAIFERMGYGVGIAVTHQGLGTLAAQRGRRGEALREFAEALTTFRDIGDVRGVGEVLFSYAALADALDDHEATLRFTGAGEQLLARSGTALMPQTVEASAARIARAEAALGGRAAALIEAGRSWDDERIVSSALGYRVDLDEQPAPQPG